jgi:hypothetical protein
MKEPNLKLFSSLPLLIIKSLTLNKCRVCVSMTLEFATLIFNVQCAYKKSELLSPTYYLLLA